MNAGWPQAAQAAEAGLFGDTLSCDAVLPADFRAGVAGSGRLPQAEALLLSLAQVEDLRGEEGGEEKRGELPLLAQRMDAKLDLMLVLLGRLVRQSLDALPARTLRWSARGLRLRLEAGTPAPATDTPGLLRLQPSDWLPDELELPASVAATASDDGGLWLWLRFPVLPTGLEEAMGRQLFRMHRRQIADARRR
ncbi:hypothetical protein B1992_11540 [Pseudoxanthomonas broegbernensis]|uniref:Cyclic di-GMP receptor atypical PilZ domain-containing protein n=1 Tax=Pseudoxanthomonas broegbernensis TaxID=83619 RepID=A0A7V8GLB1_9GAMM|nr:PilZ domain-containing protein [Pseudoxanthomonas broegbernensis]KAF1685591.1 hypothetical protein B1992_11540 [Pseudoxanthomonas broegbernensis]MBB6065965.1 hypothetical protein [Pseudoxanthomonas broegbernensis]